MFVYSPSQAWSVQDAMRRAEAVLSSRNNSYILYLARSSDDDAIEFLNRYADEIDRKTGGTVAFLVLSDNISARLDGSPRSDDESGYPFKTEHTGAAWVDSYPLYPDGRPSGELQRPEIRGRSSRHELWARSSGRLSEKFAVAHNLTIDQLPCMLIFDSLEVSTNEQCIILPVDGKGTWSILERALEAYRNAAGIPEREKVVAVMDAAAGKVREANSTINYLTRAQRTIAAAVVPGTRRALESVFDMNGHVRWPFAPEARIVMEECSDPKVAKIASDYVAITRDELNARRYYDAVYALRRLRMHFNRHQTEGSANSLLRLQRTLDRAFKGLDFRGGIDDFKTIESIKSLEDALEQSLPDIKIVSTALQDGLMREINARQKLLPSLENDMVIAEARVPGQVRLSLLPFIAAAQSDRKAAIAREGAAPVTGREMVVLTVGTAGFLSSIVTIWQGFS